MSEPLEIPLCAPSLDARDAEAVRSCVESGWVSSSGPFVGRFERAFAERLGVARAVAMQSGTAALHTALLVAGVGPGDAVLVSGLSFIAPANAIRYVGATPVFIDADPRYWQMDPDQVESFVAMRCETRRGILHDRETGRRVAAVLAVHILGHPVDIDSIAQVARRHDLCLIEDASQGLGARYRGAHVGTLGDLACFSFNGNKIITCGGGGMLVARETALSERARWLASQARNDVFEGVHGAVGFNYRLSNLHAALGSSQLDRLEAHLEAKRTIAQRYREGLAGIPGLRAAPEAPWAESAFWLYTVRVDREYGMRARPLSRALAERGIETRPLWQPLYASPAFRGLDPHRCPVADGVWASALSLPCSVALGDDQERVLGALRELGPRRVARHSPAACTPRAGSSPPSSECR